jgi:hypothetical protein
MYLLTVFPWLLQPPNNGQITICSSKNWTTVMLEHQRDESAGASSYGKDIAVPGREGP